MRRSIALAVPAHAQGALEKTKVHIAVGGKAAFYYLPLTIAEQLGYFKAEGLDVTISDFAGGSQSLRAVVGGSADVVSGAYEHTINLQAKNQILQCFALQGRAPQMSVGIATSKAAEYKSGKDLKGMKIGVSAPGSSTNMLVNQMLAKDGLKPSDVSIVGVGTGAGRDRRHEERPDRRHLQHRSGDDQAGAGRRGQDHRRYAHAQGHRTGVRRPDAGRAACMRRSHSCATIRTPRRR